MRVRLKIVIGVFSLVGSTVLVSCGGGGGSYYPPDDYDSTRIESFEASPREVRLADSVELSWHAVNPGSNDEVESPCALSTRFENHDADDPMYVPCSGKRTLWPQWPDDSGYMNIQLSVLKKNFDASEPYLIEVNKVELQADSGPPADAVLIAAESTDEVVLDERSYQPGEVVVFRLAVPLFVQTSEAMVVEVDQDVRLELLSRDYVQVLFSSTSRRSFRRGVAGAPGGSVTLPRGVGPAGISVVHNCRGSCINLKADDGVYYVRVRNTAATEQTISLYAYSNFLTDLNEPENDPDYDYDPPELEGYASTGAIETVGDVDYWDSPYTEQLMFTTVEDAIALEIHRLDWDGTVTGGPYFNGETFEALSGEILRVRAVDPNEAATSAYSVYFIERVL